MSGITLIKGWQRTWLRRPGVGCCVAKPWFSNRGRVEVETLPSLQSRSDPGLQDFPWYRRREYRFGTCRKPGPRHEFTSKQFLLSGPQSPSTSECSHWWPTGSWGPRLCRHVTEVAKAPHLLGYLASSREGYLLVFVSKR